MNGNSVFQEEPKEEIIGGKVVRMLTAPTNHNRISGNIMRVFDNYLHGSPCEPFMHGPTVYLESGTEEYLPDGLVVCDPDKVGTDGIYGAPDLVVEVLSPSTGRYDRGHKKDVYEAHGVREYWIVSPGDRSVEQYVLDDGKFVLRDVYQQYPEYALKRMTEEERAAIPTAFRCTLFDDLEIRLEDVFYRLPPVE